jgi:hypothetical protein
MVTETSGPKVEGHHGREVQQSLPGSDAGMIMGAVFMIRNMRGIISALGEMSDAVRAGRRYAAA